MKKYSKPQQRKIRDALHAAVSMDHKQTALYQLLVLLTTPYDHFSANPDFLNYMNKLRINKAIQKPLGPNLSKKKLSTTHVRCLQSIFQTVADSIERTHPNKWHVAQDGAGFHVTRFSLRGALPVHKHFKITSGAQSFQVSTQINDGRVDQRYDASIISQRHDPFIAKIETVHDALSYASLWLLSHKTLNKPRVAQAIADWEPF